MLDEVGLRRPACSSATRTSSPVASSSGSRSRWRSRAGPRLIVLDEPTTGLDVTTQRHGAGDGARAGSAYGVAAVYVSHDLAVVGELADRVAVMYAGGWSRPGRRHDGVQRPGAPLHRGAAAGRARRRTTGGARAAWRAPAAARAPAAGLLVRPALPAARRPVHGGPAAAARDRAARPCRALRAARRAGGRARGVPDGAAHGSRRSRSPTSPPALRVAGLEASYRSGPVLHGVATCSPAGFYLGTRLWPPPCRTWDWRSRCATPAFACCAQMWATSMCWKR